MSAMTRTSFALTILTIPVAAVINLAGCSAESVPGPEAGSAGVGGGSAGVGGGVAGGGAGKGGAPTAGTSNTAGSATTAGTSAGGNAAAGAGMSAGGNATGGNATGGAGTNAGGNATGGAGTNAGGNATGGAGTGAGGSATGGAGTGAGGGGGGSGPVTCTLPTFPEASALPDLGMKLPDPFTFFDGTPVTTKAQWECRRQEILAMAAKYLYGPVPGDCDEVSGTVSGGTVNITCKVGSNTATFSASISGSGKSINLSLGSGILPQGKSLSLGSGNDAKIRMLYGISELNPNIANAWMVNRVIDVLEQNPTSGHDPKTLAVSGCSGCGKGAFLVGVFSRIPIVVIVESGGGGGSSWRMNEWFAHGQGQSIWDCTDRPQGIDVLEETGICGPWVTGAASYFRSNPAKVNSMPFDQHLLLATIAPRYLVHFTNANNAGSWCWLGGTSEALASWAAHSVYKALGVEKNHSFEVYSGGHCGVGDTGIAANMFKRALDGDMAADTGKINIQDSRVQLPVADWKDLFVDWNMDTVLQ